MEVEIIEGQWAVLGVNLGHPVVTDSIFSMRGGDAAHPKLLWAFLFKCCSFVCTEGVFSGEYYAL